MNTKKYRKGMLALCMAIAMMTACLGMAYGADAPLMPTVSDNVQVALRPTSSLTATDGGYVRVFYDGKKVVAENYDDDFQILSKKTLEMELPYWGGFYAGSDGFYLIEGQSNTTESDTAEVIRVIKYDKEWNRLGAAAITPNPILFGGDVRYPFDHGTMEAVEYDGKLYIVTAHQGYVDEAVGQGHQGFLMMEVDMTSMTGQIVDCDLWHSFAQYIKEKDGSLYVLEQSEGSRCTYLSRKDANAMTTTGIDVLPYGGERTSAWAVECYASVDDLELSNSHAMGLGTSIDQSLYDTVTEAVPHNLYLTLTPLDDFTKEATQVKWLTSFTGNGTSFTGAKLTKINDNRFMVSWEISGETGTGTADDTLSGYIHHYMFLDGEGNPVSDEYTAAAPLSDCQMVVKNGKAVYYASNGNMVNFYTIDGQTGAFEKKCYRVAGQHATWALQDGKLTLSGSGAITVDTEAYDRGTLSSTTMWSSYSSADNCWKPIRDKVKSMEFKGGITSIPNEAFCYFDELTEVTIEPGMISIGEKAFYECDCLRKITIPATVTSLGEDFLWSGYYSIYDDRHLVYATIYAPEGSYAFQYADQNGIKKEDPNASIEEDNEPDEPDEPDKPNEPGGTNSGTTGGANSGTVTEPEDEGTTDIGNSGVVEDAITVGTPKSINVRLAKGNSDSVYANWSAVKVSGQNVKYKVQYRYGKGTWKTVAKSTTKKSWTLKNLQRGKKITIRVTPFVVTDSGTYTGKAKTSSAVYTLQKVNKPVVKKDTKSKVKITWKNINGETGYEIYKSAKKTKGFKLAKRVKGTKIKSTTVKADKNKKFYYKVRAYKNIRIGKKTYRVYGPWSKVTEFKLK